jgi:hypothetical protein
MEIAKRTVLLAFLGAMLCAFGCTKPQIVPRDGRNFQLAERGEELFVYVDYTWKGGKFDDAVALENAFAAYAEDQGILVYAMGRFPTMKQWQLGFVASKKPEITEFQGRPISVMTLPAGDYAELQTVSNVDYLFMYWKKLAKWLKAEGHKLESPVIEVYPDISNKDLAVEEVRGALRYRVTGKP